MSRKTLVIHNDNNDEVGKLDKDAVEAAQKPKAPIQKMFVTVNSESSIISPSKCQKKGLFSERSEKSFQPSNTKG